MSGGDWEEYKRLVVHELERCNSRLDTLDNRLRNIESKLSILDTKIYVTALFASAIFTGVVNYLIS